jgi:hypothetical protein
MNKKRMDTVIWFQVVWKIVYKEIKVIPINAYIVKSIIFCQVMASRVKSVEPLIHKKMVAKDVLQLMFVKNAWKDIIILLTLDNVDLFLLRKKDKMMKFTVLESEKKYFKIILIVKAGFFHAQMDSLTQQHPQTLNFW